MRRPYGEATAQLIDDEVKRIAEECATQARELLERHRGQLDALVRALLDHDSLGEREILEVTGLPTPVEGGARRAPSPTHNGRTTAKRRLR
jgi:cell division protease FtsH